MDTDYFKEFKIEVTYLQKLLKKKFSNCTDASKPSFFLHEAGYIQEQGYPVYHFSEEDILKITYALTGDCCNLSKEHIIKHFQSRGLVFPVTRYDIIAFLLNFEQMIEGL